MAYFPRYDPDRMENNVSNEPSNNVCVFVAAVTLLSSRRLATTGRFFPSRFLAKTGLHI
jgi:hypothetical protein